MKLYQEILINALEQEDCQLIFPNLNLDTSQIVEKSLYSAFNKIKSLLENTEITDENAYSIILEIDSILNCIGIKINNTSLLF